MSIDETKAEIRRRINKFRDDLDPDFLKKAGLRGADLATILTKRVKPHRVGIYLPKGNEYPTRVCADLLRKAGIELALPAIRGDEIEFYRYDSEDELIPGVFGIPTPPLEEERHISPRNLDAMIIPGVAFDRNYNRMGWGRGYYDRYLRKIRPETVTVGLAYEFQILNKIPVSPGDQPVKHIFSERREYGLI